jgi:hypothetical protein
MSTVCPAGGISAPVTERAAPGRYRAVEEGRGCLGSSAHRLPLVECSASTASVVSAVVSQDDAGVEELAPPPPFVQGPDPGAPSRPYARASVSAAKKGLVDLPKSWGLALIAVSAV